MTMLAAVLHAFDDLRLEQVACPRPRHFPLSQIGQALEVMGGEGRTKVIVNP